MSLRSIDSSAFRHHVDRYLAPLHADLSTRRREARNQLILRSAISAVLIVGVAGSGWWTYRAEDEFYWWLLLFAVFAIGVALFLWCALPWFSHRDRLKHDVLTRLVPFFGDFSFLPDARLTPAQFDDCGLMPRYNRHSAEDEVSGSHRGVAFRAADVRLRYEYTTRRSGSSGSSKSVETVFKGVLMEIDLPEAVTGRVVLGTPDMFSGRFTVKENSGLMRFELARGGLEAWTDDPEAAARLLDADRTDRVAALVSRVGVRSLRMAWHGSSVAMLLDFGQDFFELPMLGEIDFRKFGEIVQDQLARLTRVIELLDLPAASADEPATERPLEERMRAGNALEADFEKQDRGCLPIVVLTVAGFCSYLWLLTDQVRPLGALGLAFVFGTMAGFALGCLVTRQRGGCSAWPLLLIGLLGIAPALPDETLDRLPGGQWVKSIKLDD